AYMALEISPRIELIPVRSLEAFPLELPTIAERVAVRIVNQADFQEATLRKVITPRVEIAEAGNEVRLISQGLSLSEERRISGREALLIEVAARYRRGEGAIKQIYRYLVFAENNKIYCQRLPMGSWAPSDPDICLEWLGRSGLQQGDFVLLPRKRLPPDALPVPRPDRGNLLKRTMAAIQTFIGEALLEEEVNVPDWNRIIGRHDPVDCQLYKRDARYYLVAPHDTVSNHPEHAQLRIPEGYYEVVEDRASSYWRKAID
ncbi:MAG: hypothetical protein HY692_04530, partial [Cyanobacteria bacterium NC_groundwater_1444_Ag_S-0.65um_54_12]|nr:hypothetical protein [Cyanobacteria bacterium NC_groundwater_1444_Ag_S-0.65um_54_12]